MPAPARPETDSSESIDTTSESDYYAEGEEGNDKMQEQREVLPTAVT